MLWLSCRVARYAGVTFAGFLLAHAPAAGQAPGWYLSVGAGQSQGHDVVDWGTGITLLDSRLEFEAAARRMRGLTECLNAGSGSCSYAGHVLRIAASVAPVSVGILRPYGALSIGRYAHEAGYWSRTGWGSEVGIGLRIRARGMLRIGSAHFDAFHSDSRYFDGLVVRLRWVVAWLSR